MIGLLRGILGMCWAMAGFWVEVFALGFVDKAGQNFADWCHERFVGDDTEAEE